MIKKRFFIISLIIFLFSFGAISQETNTLNKIKEKIDFSIQLGPALYINTQSVLVSAPSPVLFPVSLGVIWPAKRMISVQPSLSFFVMNYLWYDGKALPAEIENRTATAYTLFLNIPATMSIFAKSCKIQFSAGAGMMFRIINLSIDVYPTDCGNSGSAQSDVNLITEYLWGGARFLYITTEISCLFNITRNLRTGPVIGAYIPLGSIINNEGFASFIAYAGLKITL